MKKIRLLIREELNKDVYYSTDDIRNNPILKSITLNCFKKLTKRFPDNDTIRRKINKLEMAAQNLVAKHKSSTELDIDENELYNLKLAIDSNQLYKLYPVFGLKEIKDCYERISIFIKSKKTFSNHPINIQGYHFIQQFQLNQEDNNNTDSETKIKLIIK